MNKYYTADKEFTVLRAIGSKPSNTYIGNSQVIDTVYAKTTVLPGEELHDLVGGLFHIDSEGTPYEIRLTPPVHIFQAKYHWRAEGDRIKELLKDGAIKPEESPAIVERYRY